MICFLYVVINTRYVLVLLINEDRPGVLKYAHLYIQLGILKDARYKIGGANLEMPIELNCLVSNIDRNPWRPLLYPAVHICCSA